MIFLAMGFQFPVRQTQDKVNCFYDFPPKKFLSLAHTQRMTQVPEPLFEKLNDVTLDRSERGKVSGNVQLTHGALLSLCYSLFNFRFSSFSGISLLIGPYVMLAESVQLLSLLLCPVTRTYFSLVGS